MKFHRRTIILLAAGVMALLVIQFGTLSTQAQDPAGQGPFISEPVTPQLSQPVSQLPVVIANQSGGPAPELNPRRVNPPGLLHWTGKADMPDPLLQQKAAQSLVRTPVLSNSFEGISFITGGSGVPPDTNGDVGPTRYVQIVNSSFAIYDKNGTKLTGPTNINQLWAGKGGLCEANNDGDPIVLYDSLADRWLLSQFAVPGPNHAECIAISQTSNPAGAYYLYEFSFGASFPDYPKLAVWPDAYYMSTNETTYTAYAFDRPKMLVGQPATFQKFSGQTNFMLPSDLDGSFAPPAGSPNYFYTFKDNSFPSHGGGIDRLELFAFHADFTSPANSTFTQIASIPIASFTYTVCGFFNLECIPQPAPGETLDPISEWPMWRLAYRNFGSYEAMVGNFTVDVGNDRAGIRWFELRKSSGGTWSLYQQGTHAPDAANHRWMGSIAMDKNGNIGLGYSTSGSSLFPSLRYATRLITETLGTLESERTLIAGGGMQLFGGNRWGDYSAMSIDPADDCTFWYTGEYYAASAASNWQTRIGSFKLPTCTKNSVTLIKQANITHPAPGQPVIYTLTILNTGVSTITNGVIFDTLPAGLTLAGAVTINPPNAGTIGTGPAFVTNLTVPAKQFVRVNIPVRLDAGLAQNTVIINTASVTSPQLSTLATGAASITVGYGAYLPLIRKNN